MMVDSNLITQSYFRILNHLCFEKEYLEEKQLPRIVITKAGLDFVTEVIPSWNNAMAEIKSELSENGVNAIDEVISKLTKK